jgi:hypothetical protein
MGTGVNRIAVHQAAPLIQKGFILPPLPFDKTLQVFPYQGVHGSVIFQGGFTGFL